MTELYRYLASNGVDEGVASGIQDAFYVDPIHGVQEHIASNCPDQEDEIVNLVMTWQIEMGVHEPW